MPNVPVRHIKMRARKALKKMRPRKACAKCVHLSYVKKMKARKACKRRKARKK